MSGRFFAKGWRHRAPGIVGLKVGAATSRASTLWRQTLRVVVKLIHKTLAVLMIASLLGAQAQADDAPPALAPVLSYPQASPSSAAAIKNFAERDLAAIEFNACNREGEYGFYRTRYTRDPPDFSEEGEITEILMAKVVHLARYPTHSCTGQVRKQDLPGLRETYARPECAIALPEQPDDLVGVTVSNTCMTYQINEIMQMLRAFGRLGTDGLFCLENPFASDASTKGDADASVVAFTRLLYLSAQQAHGPLTDDTVKAMYQNLLLTSGPPSPDSYSLVTCDSLPAGDTLGTPEDRADQNEWYKELASSILDGLEWLSQLFVRLSLFSAIQPAVLSATPFLVLGGTHIDATPLLAPVTPFTDVHIAETENHRLMIESSRFLVNADMIARLEKENYPHVDDIKADQAKVREWLLQRLQTIAIHDFSEYNSRPYTRYSLNAIVNLFDFGATHGDSAMQTAAWIVLDLSEAKFAATSNRGRRIAPFRRRSEYDGYDAGTHAPTPDSNQLYNIVKGADFEVARAMFLANQTQLLPDQRATPEAIRHLVTTVTSNYRLPDAVLGTAVERRTFAQTFSHTGVERVYQAPAYLITAGGIPTEPTASVLGKSDDNDYGVAMPTTIIPTISGWQYDDIFRFDGVGVQQERSANTCVAPGFACGVQPWFGRFAACTESEGTPGEHLYVINSLTCQPDVRPAFFLAGRSSACTDTFCERGRFWGVMDIVDPSTPGIPGFEQFKADRKAALAAIKPDENGRASYRTTAGVNVDFTLKETHPDVLAIDGAAPPAWTTAGAVVDADGKGHATIKNADGTPAVIIDFTDWQNPRRTVPALPGAGNGVILK